MENNVECNFDQVYTRGIIQTIYHDIDYQLDYPLKVGDTLSTLYANESFVDSMLMNSERCIRSILQTCHPPGDYVANMTENEGYTCPCVRLFNTYPVNNS